MHTNRDGYRYVVLSKDGERYTKKIHRLVAEHFVDNPDNKPNVNHIDGIKTNNELWNLEWCTQKENVQHAYDIGLVSQKGIENNASKLTQAKADLICLQYAFGTTQQKLAEKFGVGQATISRVLNKESYV